MRLDSMLVLSPRVVRWRGTMSWIPAAAPLYLPRDLAYLPVRVYSASVHRPFYHSSPVRAPHRHAMLPDSKKLPDLRSVREPRHPGISEGVCAAFSEAAEVALARHHEPPTTLFSVTCDGSVTARSLSWMAPTAVALRAWNNADDTTRDGAYILVIAAVEAELGMVALGRAETRTGADYYVGSLDTDDLESALRLEVSGVNAGSGRIIRTRLKQKITQARRGISNLPAMAGVVGFREAAILLKHVDESYGE